MDVAFCLTFVLPLMNVSFFCYSYFAGVGVPYNHRFVCKFVLKVELDLDYRREKKDRHGSEGVAIRY